MFFLSTLNSLFLSSFVLLFYKVIGFLLLFLHVYNVLPSLLPRTFSCPSYSTHWLPSEVPLPLPYREKKKLDPACKRTHGIFVFWMLLLSVWFGLGLAGKEIRSYVAPSSFKVTVSLRLVRTHGHPVSGCHMGCVFLSLVCLSV